MHDSSSRIGDSKKEISSGDGLEIEEEVIEKEPRPIGFHVRRIFGFINVSLLYALVFFQRTCPSIVSADMAEDYHVPMKDLGVFSSIYFYPYAFIQPFAGLLADIIDPAYVIGAGQLLAGTGAIICGLSKSLSVGCVGRFFVGLGCGPSYVPIIRIIANWFPLKYYAHFCGLCLAIGALGGIVAQGPLSEFAEAVGWRWSFYGIGGLGIILAITELIFVRGDPTSFGYKPVNKDLARKSGTETSAKEKMLQLYQNFKEVVTYGWFWVVVVYSFFCSGPYFDISGMWAGPFLTDTYQFSKSKVGNTQIALSVGLVAGSLFVPPISSWCHTRKWVLFVADIIATISMSVLAIWGSEVPYAVLIILFLLIGMFTNSLTSVCYPLIREYFHPAIAGTAVGCANIFTFLSSAIFQNISGEVIAMFPFKEGEIPPSDTANTEKGYKIGLWMICAIGLGISTIAIAFAKDSKIGAEVSSKSKDAPTDEKDEVGSDLGEL